MQDYVDYEFAALIYLFVDVNQNVRVHDVLIVCLQSNWFGATSCPAHKRKCHSDRASRVAAVRLRQRRLLSFDERRRSQR